MVKYSRDFFAGIAQIFYKTYKAEELYQGSFHKQLLFAHNFRENLRFIITLVYLGRGGSYWSLLFCSE
jgi:hypothetical protein